MKKTFKLTAQGIKELKKESVALIANRPAVAEKIKLAREFGDLAENAEYSSARQDQEREEIRISEIKYILENVERIDNPKDKNIVELGNTVKLKGNGADKLFTIVGSVETDPTQGKISNESPIGKALLGKKLGQKVEIVTPKETTTYLIASID